MTDQTLVFISDMRVFTCTRGCHCGFSLCISKFFRLLNNDLTPLLLYWLTQEKGERMKSKLACVRNCRFRFVPVMFLVLGGIFVVYGASRGEVQTVFTKAVRICLECVGIG